MKAMNRNLFTPVKIHDHEIVKRVLEGEKELFEILLRRHNQTLYRVIRSYLKSEETVADLMQDTYLKAYQKLNLFKGNASFSTWLIRIGINESLQYIRRNKVIEINSKPNESEIKLVRLPDTFQMNPEKQMIKKETHLLIEKAIDRLPEKYRIIYMLNEVEGLSNTEIVNCLDLSPENVKVRLHRARKLLKEELYLLTNQIDIFEFGNGRCDLLVEKVMRLL